ncbi:MAG: hydroxyisourate hydrolase [Chitinophagaceae bacterium]|nr:hydroxyisourate hydrolase [Oligoflexus sp.]
MGRLTTHVLDTAVGKPGRNIAIVLYRQLGSSRQKICELRTNEDGRCNRPLLEGESLTVGTYELDFDVGDYFKVQGTALPEPPFLDIVTLRFGVADSAAHYHVPLLVSPWAYSTYRGS